MFYRLRNPGLAVAVCVLLVTACAGTSTQKSTGEYVDDAVVVTKVKAALVKSERVDALEVNVDAYKGDVVLSGFVDSRAEATEAARVATRIAGVKRVDNKLELKPSQ